MRRFTNPFCDPTTRAHDWNPRRNESIYYACVSKYLRSTILNRLCPIVIGGRGKYMHPVNIFGEQPPMLDSTYFAVLYVNSCVLLPNCMWKINVQVRSTIAYSLRIKFSIIIYIRSMRDYYMHFFIRLYNISLSRIHRATTLERDV